MTYQTIHIIARTPNFIPGPFYVCGNLEIFGNWTEHIPMQAFAEDEYIFSVKLTREELLRLEFKFTLGDFELVELDSSGQEIDNRYLPALESGLSEVHFQIDNIRGYERNEVSSIIENSLNLGNFESKILNNPRNLTVVFPPSYHSNPQQKYPVLYLHDGNNMFDCQQSYGGVEWALDKTALKLMQANLIEEIILVGVANTSEREKEYTPTKVRNRGGLGNNYLDCLVTEIIPYVESKLRVDDNKRGLMGSSYGGLITLLAAKNKPDVFSRLGIISPSLGWDKEWMIRNFDLDCLRNCKVWMDIGTKEFGAPTKPFGVKYVDRVLRLDQILRKLPTENYAFYQDAEAVHNEMSWNRRAHLPLIFLYGNQSLQWKQFEIWRDKPLCTWLKKTRKL